MKGKLAKTEKGWFVRHTEKTVTRLFPLHSEDANNVYSLGKEVDFEIVGIDVGSGISQTFAKIIIQSLKQPKKD